LLTAAIFGLLPDSHDLEVPRALEKWSHLPVYIPAIEWEVGRPDRLHQRHHADVHLHDRRLADRDRVSLQQ
jgi:hypothetical protein